jgi:hypothetical protein
MSDHGALGRGFFAGIHGTAFALAHAGDSNRAANVLDRALKKPAPESLNFFDGLPGILLNLLHFAARLNDERLRDIAIEHASSMVVRLSQGDSEASPAGIFSGRSGMALALIASFEHTGDSRFLDIAENCIRKDLAMGSFLPDGTFQLQVGRKNLLYFDGGSIGVGFVLLKFLVHRSNAEFEMVVNGVLLGCRAPFVFQPGLFQGRLGLIAFALACANAGRNAVAYDIAAQVRRLGWHAVLVNETLTIPGTGLMRASTDLATGAAGALLVLCSIFEDRPLSFPFL